MIEHAPRGRLIHSLYAVACLLVLLTALSVLWTGSAVRAAAMPPTTTVRLAPGGLLRADVAGFAPRTPVTERRTHLAASRLTADARGVVHLRERVQARPGKVRYTLIGLPHRAPGAPISTTGPGDHQVVTAIVPRVQIIDVIIVAPGGHGDDGNGTGGTGGHKNPHGGNGAGGVASTGVDLEPPVVFAAVAVVFGAALTAAGRRRLA